MTDMKVNLLIQFTLWQFNMKSG